MKLATLAVVVASCLAAALFLSSAVLASDGMHSAGFSIPWSAVNGGNERMASAQLQMQGTVTLGAIHGARSSQFELSSGYWPGAVGYLGPIQPRWRIYLPLVLHQP